MDVYLDFGLKLNFNGLFMALGGAKGYPEMCRLTGIFVRSIKRHCVYAENTIL